VKRVRAEILQSRRLGAYHAITLVAPEIAESARPGQFLQVAVPTGRDILLRRPFWIHKASRQGGWSGTLEFSFDPTEEGSEWLGKVTAHEFLDVIGPLGRGFAYPKSRNNCLLVSEGYAAGQLYFLAEELKALGKRVDMILAAPTQEGVFKPIEAKRLSQTISVVTGEGGVEEAARVTGALPGTIERCGSNVVYAAGPVSMLRAVAEYCRAKQIPSQVAVEERMACGWGQCYTCVVPVSRKEGSGFDYLRSCVDGPVFNSTRILWDKWLGNIAPPAARERT